MLSKTASLRLRLALGTLRRPLRKTCNCTKRLLKKLRKAILLRARAETLRG
jgi:hypothetical protein